MGTNLSADPREFLHALDVGSGLPVPTSVPTATPRTLTFRVLATIAETGFKTVDPIEILPPFHSVFGYTRRSNVSLGGCHVPRRVSSVSRSLGAGEVQAEPPCPSDVLPTPLTR